MVALIVGALLVLLAVTFLVWPRKGVNAIEATDEVFDEALAEMERAAHPFEQWRL